MTRSDQNQHTTSVRAEHALEQHLPPDSTGYIRPLTPEEAEQVYEMPGGYAFVNADGEVRAVVNRRRLLQQTVRENGYQLFTVH